MNIIKEKNMGNLVVISGPSGAGKVLVSTKAFGMGIDIDDNQSATYKRS